MRFQVCSLGLSKSTLALANVSFQKEVNHGGSEGLTLICLLGIHSLAIELMAVFMLSA